MALYPGHPGRVWRTPIQHVQVIWVGLEEEPASYAVGFTVDDITDVTVPAWVYSAKLSTNDEAA